MEIAPELELRDWHTCDPSTQRAVFQWCDDPQIPDHASRSMVAATVLRGTDPTDGNLPKTRCWIAHLRDRPVAFIAGDIATRWVEPGEFRPATPSIDVPGPILSISTLVDPSLWGRGVSAAAKAAVMAHPTTQEVASFHACIRADNFRSVAAILKVTGIEFLGTEADRGYLWHHYRWPRRVAQGTGRD